jgi:hypothetical protein
MKSVNHHHNTLPAQIRQRIQQSPHQIWTPVDFLDLGNRSRVDKTLQRLVADHSLRRIDRGIYDQPSLNPLTGQLTRPDYRQIISALARRDQMRILIDGITAANDLGLSNAVPAKVIVHTDVRLRPIHYDQLTIQFKLTAPSKLYWADRPAMRLVQSLYWLHDTLKSDALSEDTALQNKILRLLQDPQQGPHLQNDLHQGLPILPAWMQDWLRPILAQIQAKEIL